MEVIKEFKEFAMRGNMVDMAVGVIVGGAFGKIVSSLVKDVVMPPIGLFLGKVDFSNLAVTLREKGPDAEAVTLKYGIFINTVLEFVIVAICVFLLIRQLNRLVKKPEPAAPTTKECPRCISAIPLQATRCPNCTTEL